MVVAVLTAALLVLIAAVVLPTVAFVADLSGGADSLRAWLPVTRYDVEAASLAVPTRYGVIPARVYRTRPASARTVVVIPGVHAAGVDEPRLDRFSARLASTGMTVITAPVPDLRAFRVTSRSTDQIEDATNWVLSQRDLTPRGRAGLVGVSFAGGLAVVAAGRPALDGRLDLVLSVGGYGDLARALHYMCTGQQADGTQLVPHDYGLAVLTLAGVRHLVPAAQVASLEQGIVAYLEASADEPPLTAKGIALLDNARALQATMPEPSRSILSEVLNREIDVLGRRLTPWVDELARDPALSPERSPVPHVPVFLLHGRSDNVIPSSEAPALAAYLAAQGNARVTMLRTSAVSHVGLHGRPSVGEAWQLFTFWRAVLAALR